MELLQIVAKFFEYITAWLPRPYLVNVTERVVRFRTGNEPVLVEPGFHFYVPLVSSIERFSLLKDAVQFNPVVMPTRDAKSVAVGFVVIWHLESDNVIKAATTTDDLVQMIGEYSQGLLPSLVLQYDFDELLDRVRGAGRTKSFDSYLTQEARELLKEFGVTVDRARINFLSQARVFHLVNSGAAAS